MNRRRVVITGIGIVSSIGNNADEVADALRQGRSGISFSEDYKEHGFRSQIHGKPNIDLTEHINKRQPPIHGRRSGIQLHFDAAGDRRQRSRGRRGHRTREPG